MLEPEKPGKGGNNPNNPGAQQQKDEKPGMGSGTAPDQEGLDPKNIPAKE